MADERYVKERWSYQVRDEKAQEAEAVTLKAQIDEAGNDPEFLKWFRKAPRR